MDFQFSEEQNRFRQELRDFFKNEPRGKRVDWEIEENYSPEFYQKLAVKGWIGLHWLEGICYRCSHRRLHLPHDQNWARHSQGRRHYLFYGGPEDAGTVVGGIGARGRMAQEDEQIARDGLSALKLYTCCASPAPMRKTGGRRCKKRLD
jgi:alkylation response protein AidB-like acyl-CoA dehydrogenase